MPTLLISGTNRGLGLEFVQRYHAAGWRILALNRRHSEELRILEKAGNVRVLLGDLCDGDRLQEFAAELANERIDLLINNAGVMGGNKFRKVAGERQSLLDFDRDEWRQVFEINVFTPAQLISIFREHLSDSAKVVTLSSEMGSIADINFVGWFAYRASKSAVNSLMKSVALSLKERGIPALALHPGWVRTELGGPNANIDTATSVTGMMKVIDALDMKRSGDFLAYDGTELPY